MTIPRAASPKNSPTMKNIFDQVRAYLTERYDINILIQGRGSDNYVDVADFAEKTIRINADARNEEGLVFIVLHLFGHMVQFSHYENYKDLVEETERPKPLLLSEDFKTKFYSYEREAYEIGSALLRAAAGDEVSESLARHFRIYLETDFDIFWTYLTTGIQTSPTKFEETLHDNYALFPADISFLERGELPEDVRPKKNVTVY
jgi:hypothetical protein